MGQAGTVTQDFLSTPSHVNARMITAVMVGNVFEWYDFVIYGSLTPILAMVFFPGQDRFIAMLLTFAIFASGFLTRPLGGLIFGHIGDSQGRRKALIVSVLLMAVPALCIAMLPTYNQVGKFAPILLLLCRMLQGLAAGGEKPVVVTYIGELAPPRFRGFVCSFAGTTQIMGVLLASVVVASLTQTLSETQMLSWGWRVPFLFTLFSVFFGLYLRLKLLETKAFKQAKQEKLLHKRPVIQSLKTNKKAMTTIFLYMLFGSAAYYSYNIFIMSYLKETIGMSYLEALQISIISCSFLIVLIPLSALLSDKVGRKKIMLVGLFGFVVFSYPIYTLYSYASFPAVLLAQFCFAVMLSLLYGSAEAIMIEQVDTQLRCSSVGLAYNIAQVIFGGTAPIVNMLLIKHFETELAPSFYLMLTALIASIGVFYMRDKTGKELS